MENDIEGKAPLPFSPLLTELTTCRLHPAPLAQCAQLAQGRVPNLPHGYAPGPPQPQDARLHEGALRLRSQARDGVSEWYCMAAWVRDGERGTRRWW